MELLNIISTLTFVSMSIYIPFSVKKDRARNIRDIAEEMGFIFFLECTKRTDPNIFGSKKNNTYSIFYSNHNLELNNVMKGKVNGIRVYIGDYYITGKNKEEAVTAIIFSDKKFNFPVFSLIQENMENKLKDIISKKDIDFETNKLFSDKYFLRGNDEQAVRDFFKKRVRNILESYPEELSIEASENNISFYFRLTPPNLIKRKLNECEMILNSF